MGATLPAIARWVETTPSGRGLARLLLRRQPRRRSRRKSSGRVLPAARLRHADATTSRWVLNVIVARSRAAGRRARHKVGITAMPARRRPGSPWPRAARLRRDCAVGSDGAGRRGGVDALLSLLFGATIYTFSLILAVFLVGLGIGSSLGAALRAVSNPRMALGWVQVGLCVCAGMGGVFARRVAAVLADQPVDLDRPGSTSSSISMRAIWVMLPGAILWGMSFPLALAVWPRRSGPRPAGRRCLRGEHAGRDRRALGDRPDAHGSARSSR